MASFLSCLYGSELQTTPQTNNEIFLSCLYGSELFNVIRALANPFLSCLYGSEQILCAILIPQFFLSCLYGSELKYYTFSPLLIKQNHLNLLLPPFFILTYPQH
ncbi:TPA: hypothetical protein IRM88_002121 [Escherichia coli]|nr:hypothetical protein [Escherichia coli]HAO9383940.1 hypothetical protein [Escherichia coli]